MTLSQHQLDKAKEAIDKFTLNDQTALANQCKYLGITFNVHLPNTKRDVHQGRVLALLNHRHQTLSLCSFLLFFYFQELTIKI